MTPSANSGVIAISRGLVIGPVACSANVFALPSQNYAICFSALNTVGEFTVPFRPA